MKMPIKIFASAALASFAFFSCSTGGTDADSDVLNSRENYDKSSLDPVLLDIPPPKPGLPLCADAKVNLCLPSVDPVLPVEPKPIPVDEQPSSEPAGIIIVSLGAKKWMGEQFALGSEEKKEVLIEDKSSVARDLPLLGLVWVTAAEIRELMSNYKEFAIKFPDETNY